MMSVINKTTPTQNPEQTTAMFKLIREECTSLVNDLRTHEKFGRPKQVNNLIRKIESLGSNQNVPAPVVEQLKPCLEALKKLEDSYPNVWDPNSLPVAAGAAIEPLKDAIKCLESKEAAIIPATTKHAEMLLEGCAHYLSELSKHAVGASGAPQWQFDVSEEDDGSVCMYIRVLEEWGSDPNKGIDYNHNYAGEVRLTPSKLGLNLEIQTTVPLDGTISFCKDWLQKARLEQGVHIEGLVS